MQQLSPISVEEKSIYDVLTGRKRRFILVIQTAAAFLLPFCDTVFLPSLSVIKHEFNASDTLVTLTVSVYLFMSGLLSVVWGTMSDRIGRKITLIIALALFTIMSVLCALATSIAALIVFRSLEGAAISASWIVGVSVVADLYPEKERGTAIGIFFLFPTVGPVVGPFIGGPLANFLGWRSVFLLLGVFSWLLLIAIVLFVPETHHYFVKKTLQKTNCKLQITDSTIDELLPLQNPWKSLNHLADLTIVSHIVTMVIPLVVLYLSSIIYSTALGEAPYNYSAAKIGFLFVPSGVTLFVGIFLGGWLSDKASDYFGHEKCNAGRLVPGLILSICAPLGTIIYGWSFHYKIDLAWIIVGFVLLSFGEAVIETGVSAYLTIIKKDEVSTLTAVNMTINFCATGLIASVAVFLEETMGIGPFFTVIGILNIAAIIVAGAVIYNDVKQANNAGEQESTTISGKEQTPLLHGSDSNI